jgi:tetratricopeptide (TPR) repeat protein
MAATEESPTPPSPGPEEQEAPRKTTPQALARELGRLDLVLAVLGLVFAFLLGSFAVRNSDFWMHLASGRAVAEGKGAVSSDPFSYTAGPYWANHNWLYDLVVYSISRLMGGPESPAGAAALVVLKAVVVTLLAWTMLCVRRPGASFWAPIGCAILAVLVMSTRLFFQPTLCSLLFLALTVAVLERKSRIGTWLLPVLFLVWTNTDIWFLLGPAVVLLYLVGAWLEQSMLPESWQVAPAVPGRVRALALVFIAGLAACFVHPAFFVNPSAYISTMMPPFAGITGARGTVRGDRALAINLLSPFEGDFFQFLGAGLNLAALSYYLFLLVGMVSFVLACTRTLPVSRLLTWGFFFVLSVLTIRNIPLWAALAGPITALNFQDFSIGSFGLLPRITPGWKTWSLVGRIASILLVIGLLALAWPGWLQETPFSREGQQTHRVQWTIPADVSYRQAALQLRAWREAGLIGETDHGFNYSPDFANYCAWFCPSEQGFFDYRAQRFPDTVTEQYVTIRKEFRLSTSGGPNEEGLPSTWAAAFREHGIDHVALDLLDANAPYIWPRMIGDWGRWTLLYLDGRTGIFRWNEAQASDNSRDRQAPTPFGRIPRLDPDALAFGPENPKAPAEGPGKPPARAGLIDRYVHGVPTIPLAADGALYYQAYFDDMARTWPERYIKGFSRRPDDANAWRAVVDFLRKGGELGMAPASVGIATVWDPTSQIIEAYANILVQRQAVGPTGAVILAIRAARQAIQESPDVAQPYQRMARSYQAIWGSVEDSWIGAQNRRNFARRQEMRQVQQTTALEYTLRLRPDDAESHAELFQIYQRLGWFDLALSHLEGVTRSTKKAPAEKEEDFEEKMKRLSKAANDLEAVVKKQEGAYENESKNQPLFARAAIAIKYGLAKRSLDFFLDADLSGLQIEDVQLLLYLLLHTGQPEEARVVLEKEDIKASTRLDLDWYMTLVGAASGNYALADKHLAQSIDGMQKSYVQRALSVVQAQAFHGVTLTSVSATQDTTAGLKQLADYLVIRGILLLEQGQTAKAAECFRTALDVDGGEKFQFDSRAIAVNYLELIERYSSKRP